MPNRKPRTCWICNPLQYRLLFGSLAYLVLMVLVCFLAVLFPLILELDGSAADERAQQVLAVAPVFWKIVPLIALLCLAHSLLISHRIAGPLEGFRRTMEELTKGNLGTRLRIRRTDYLAGEADAVNAMIESLDGRLDTLQQRYSSVRDSLPELRRKESTSREQDDAITALEDRVVEMGLALRKFRRWSAADVVSPLEGGAPAPFEESQQVSTEGASA